MSKPKLKKSCRAEEEEEVDCKLPTTCLIYDSWYNIRSVYLGMYCHKIFRGDGGNTHVTFENAKLVLMRLQINSTGIKQGRSIPDK